MHIFPVHGNDKVAQKRENEHLNPCNDEQSCEDGQRNMGNFF